MSLAQHYQLGKLGEKVAKGYLLQEGYVILEENWRMGKLEVDLIADDGEQIVFIEVKTRSSVKYGLPEEAVDRDKKLNLIQAAEVYVNNIHLEVEVRFDIVAVILTTESTEVKHIKDAFYPGDEWIDELP